MPKNYVNITEYTPKQLKTFEYLRSALGTDLANPTEMRNALRQAPEDIRAQWLPQFVNQNEANRARDNAGNVLRGLWNIPTTGASPEELERLKAGRNERLAAYHATVATGSIATPSKLDTPEHMLAASEFGMKTPDIEEDESPEVESETIYGAEDIVSEGCFLSTEELNNILSRWRAKKNLVLQGPPGTGKTWLAKRLGFALVGSNDRETTRSRLRIVQFHPSLAYEDFVRGWRPAGDGRLALVDGILMQAIDAAASEPDLPFVLVIEEINRGNPAQIFGEMLTLLEDTKRRPSEAMELAYRKNPGERIHIPKNLFVIGTMNVADRSLAIVDLALRRRFAFVDLEPRLGAAWREWCLKRGLDDALLAEVKIRLDSLNVEIASAISLGPQFRIGHSYVTPDIDENILNSSAWFRARVETEIGPLLDEYWYDAPETAKAARLKLLAQLA